MANRSSTGWLMMSVALAVPGFLFYNWWSHLNTQSRAQLDKHVRNRLPQGAPIFGAAPAQQKLSNPISQVNQAPAEASLAAPASAATSTSPVPTATAAQLASPAPEAPASVPLAAASAASAAGDSVLQTGPIPQIVLARDPMLSPYDMVRIAEAELKQRQAAQELLEAAKNKARGKARKAAKSEKPAESLVDLQGIVSSGDGQRAIVNGEMVGEGDIIGGVKVVRISPDAVVFLYHKKRFIKGISK